jgi:uncharacterized RDD family membrane protein YckC
MSYPDAWAPSLAELHEAALTHAVLRRRVAAFVLDGLLVAALCCVAWMVLLTFGLLTLGLGLPLLGLLPAVPVAYNWLSVASDLSATPGQYLTGLAVRRDADLVRPTPLEALVWTLGFVATISLGAIWFGFALLTRRRRTLHDLLSGLTVVRRRALQQALTGPGLVWDAPAGGPRYV